MSTNHQTGPKGGPVRIAVDVMGGDHAPDAILKGCVAALDDLCPGDTLVLVGRGHVIRESLEERGIDWHTEKRIEIVDAAQVVEMADSAKQVRVKTDSSITKMHQLGSRKAEKRCDVVLSAGNTAACVMAATLYMGRLDNVIRPGIAVTVPAFHGPLILIDAGANPDPKPEHLWQYGIMADVMARTVLGIKSPRVGLMNIGSEEAKGTDVIKQTRDLLKATPGLNYIGYVEGRDFFEGVADVVVTDGLVGNTLLKAAEGMARSLFKAIAAELMEQDPALMPKFEPIVKSIYAKNDYHEHGGAPLLGIDGACIIAHGSSEARTIRAAIRNSRKFVALGVNPAIEQRLAEVEALNIPEQVRQAAAAAAEGVQV
jgi:phosphate acyltransferase